MPKVRSKYSKIDGIRCLATRIIIPLSKITVDIESNKTRSDGEDDKHVNDLVAFIQAHGIDSDLPCPIVKQTGEDHWKLIDGHHRAAAYAYLGITEMEVDIYEFDSEGTTEAFQEVANHHPPHLMGNQQSLINTLGREIKRGDLLNVQPDIEKRVSELALGKPSTWKYIVASAVFKNNGTHEQWIKYSDARSKSHLNPMGITTAGEFNPKTGRYGAICTAASEWRILHRAIRAYNLNDHNGPGIQTDLIIKVEKKGNANVMAKRQAVVEEINRTLKDMLDATTSGAWKHGHCPIRIIGALPQDAGDIWNEKMKDENGNNIIIECDIENPRFR